MRLLGSVILGEDDIELIAKGVVNRLLGCVDGTDIDKAQDYFNKRVPKKRGRPRKSELRSHDLTREIRKKVKPFPLHPSKETVKRLTKTLPKVDNKFTKSKRGRPKVMGKCTTKGCKNPARSRGMCSKCYQRAKYHEKHPKAKTRKEK